MNLYGRDITARVQVQDALVRRTRQLETVHALTLEILEETDLSALLTLITRRAVDLVGASSGTIYLWDEAGQVLVPRAWHGLGDWVQAIRVRPGEAVVGRVVEGRQGMIVNDYQTSESTQSLILEHGRFTAVLAEPLLYRDRLVGVFGINHEEAGKRFSEEDRTLLNLFAAQAAIAIENVRLHAETIRRLTEMTALYEVGRATASSMDLDKRLEAVLTLLTHAMGAQRAMVGLVDDTQSDRCQLRLGYDQARPNPWLRHLDLSMDRYPEVQAAVRTQQPILIPNASRALLLTPVRDRLEQVGLRSLLVVPLLVQGRAIGAISLGYVGEARSFTDQEIRFCQSMADFSAAVIANARLFEQVSQAKAEWEHTFHSIRDLVAIIDTENRFVRVNRALAERFGTAPDDLVGQHCHAVFHGTETPWLGCPHLEALAEGKSTIREIEDPRLGETFLVTCSPLRDVKGNLLGTVHIAREITEQKRLEAESRQRQQFEDLSRAKSAFIANMSHELRTPLNSVIGFAELLLGQGVGPLTEKQARYLGHVQSSGKHLLKLISDILDLSKIEVGKIELQLDALAVSTTLDDILVIAHGLTHKKNQTIHADVSPDLPLLRADPVRFKQILFNLVSNAVKFTPDGGRITLRARHVTDDRRPETGSVAGPPSPVEYLEIAVTDTGVGIKAEDMPKLFQEFVQLETTRAQKHEGTGLGLALTRRLVELHGGRIWAESGGEGRGSTFTVLLPFAGPGDATTVERGSSGPSPTPTEARP